MPFMEWKDSYNVGVKEIDIQHRGLYDLISKLSRSKRIMRGDKYFQVNLSTLIRYAELHFATEERYMKEAGYLKLVEHRAEHTDFLNKISKLSTEFEQQRSNQETILSFLHDWYGDHILGNDRDYIPALQKKGFT